MKKMLLFAIAGSLAGLAGGSVGEAVLASWSVFAERLSVPGGVSDFLKVAAWTACLGTLLAIGLVVGQNVYLRRRPIGLRQFLVVVGGSLAAGLTAGAAGQAMQRGLEAAAGALSNGARTELAQALGWMLLGGLLAVCIAIFVPNLPKARAAIAGAVGGLLGAWAFFDLSELAGDTAGRLAGVAALGTCIGSMIVAAERAFRKAWLEVVYGRGESRSVSLGGEPVTVGSAAGTTIFARGAPALAMRFRLQDGRVMCDDGPTGRSAPLGDGDVRQVGQVVIRVHGDTTRQAAPAVGFGTPHLVIRGRTPVPLGAGRTLTANDIPGLSPREGATTVATVVTNPSRPGAIGLRNLSTRAWRLLGPRADAVDVPSGRAAEIQSGSRINFGSVTGSIEATSPIPAGRSRQVQLVSGVVAAGVLVGLLAAGTADFHRRHPVKPVVVDGNALPITILSLNEAGAQRPLRLGVFPTQDGYDDVGVILKDLGAGYTYAPLAWSSVITEKTELQAYDVLFLPCPGPPTKELSSDDIKSLRIAIRNYVATGGTLYASCLAWNDIMETFPEITTQEFQDCVKRFGMSTKAQDVSAEVVDHGMREQFGDTVALSFDLPGWCPPGFRDPASTVYLHGKFDLGYDINVVEAEAREKLEALLDEAKRGREKLDEETEKLKADIVARRVDRPTAERELDRLSRQHNEFEASMNARMEQVVLELRALVADAERESHRSGPLLVKMPFEEGFIIFTAFHNGKQRSRRELDLLRYLVYTTVTARLEARTKEQLVEAGFTAARHDLVTRSPGSPERAGTYACSRPGPLRFALGFNGEGVRLRLDLTSPDGRKASHETAQPVVVEVPDAAAGDWTYTVTAERLPSDNFPFTITIAEK